MTKALARSLSLLSCALVGLMALTPSSSQACGPYGGHSLIGEVTTDVSNVAETKIVAECEGREISTLVGESGHFWLMGIPADVKRCDVRAVVLGEDGAVYTTQRRVKLPKGELTLHVTA